MSGATATTKDLVHESTRIRATAAAAAANALHKMTEFMSRPDRGQSGGAGELLSGPCGLTDPATTAVATAAAATATFTDKSLQQGVVELLQLMRKLQEEHKEAQAAAQILQNVAAGSSSGPSRGEKEKNPTVHQQEDDDDGWQVWTSRKNRRGAGAGAAATGSRSNSLQAARTATS